MVFPACDATCTLTATNYELPSFTKKVTAWTQLKVVAEANAILKKVPQDLRLVGAGPK